MIKTTLHLISHPQHKNQSVKPSKYLMIHQDAVITLLTQQTSLGLVGLQCFEHPGNHQAKLGSAKKNNKVCEIN